MITIGVDPHKQTHTAVAIRAGSGELLGEHTAPARTPGYNELLAWSRELDHERVWAVEDCRHVSGGLERFLRAWRARRASPAEAHVHQPQVGADLRQRPTASTRSRSPAPRSPTRTCRTREANELEREIAKLVVTYAPQLLALPGCGALIAGRIIGEIAGIQRFRNDAQLARLAGVASLDASSGQQRRHRLTAIAA